MKSSDQKLVAVEKGKIVLNKIEELGTVIFKENPLVVKFFIVVKNVAHIEYDFGMTDEVNLSIKENYFIKSGYRGLSKESTAKEIITAMICYDIGHAFFHYELDPNYTKLHWALKGWLKDRVETYES